MGIFQTLNFVINHQLNKNRKLNAVWNWLTWQIGSRLVPGPVAVPFVNQSKLLVFPGMTGATGNIYTGLHEFEEMAFTLHLLRSNDLFIDIGANIGSYTVLAGAVKGAKCISIEPISNTYEHLIDNIRLNGITHIAEARCIGVGRQRGILKFTQSLDTTNHVLSENEQNTKDFMEVQSFSLDDIVNNSQPTLIKIDVEGFETEVIAGANRVLKSGSLLAVIMEMNGSGTRYGYDEKQLHYRMTEEGFDPFNYSPFQRQLIPLDEKRRNLGNVLYVRNAKYVSDRLVKAPAFHVGDHNI